MCLAEVVLQWYSLILQHHSLTLTYAGTISGDSADFVEIVNQNQGDL
jgi:hypothetical protein